MYIYRGRERERVHAVFTFMWKNRMISQQAPPRCVKIKRGRWVYQCVLFCFVLFFLFVLFFFIVSWERVTQRMSRRRKKEGVCRLKWRLFGERRLLPQCRGVWGRGARAGGPGTWKDSVTRTSSEISQWRELLFALMLVVFCLKWPLKSTEIALKSTEFSYGSDACYDGGPRSLSDWWQRHKSASAKSSQFWVNSFLLESGVIFKLIIFPVGYFSSLTVLTMLTAPTQGWPAGDEEPGVGPVLRRLAGEPEAEPAEVAVGDGRPLGVRAWLRPGGQAGTTVQASLQRTLTAPPLTSSPTIPHIHKQMTDWKTFILCLYINGDIF